MVVVIVEQIQTVLIDTWWNVNSAWVFSVTIKVMVLIDTWWNVNESSY